MIGPLARFFNALGDVMRSSMSKIPVSPRTASPAKQNKPRFKRRNYGLVHIQTHDWHREDVMTRKAPKLDPYAGGKNA